MKILVLDEEFPYPLNNGKRTRSFSLARVLARENELSYLAYGREDSEAVRALEAVGVRCEAVDPPDLRQGGPAFYFRLLRNLISPLPYIVTSHYSARFQRALDELVERGDFDIVLCEWSPYSIFVKSLREPPSVIVAHNIESYIWRRYEENERNPFRKWYITRQRVKVEAFERACFRWAAGATAVSDAEAREIEGYGIDYRVETVENGVDVDYFQPLSAPSAATTLIFSGALDWRPNQDAISYFVRDIFPRVRAQRPDVEFAVVGRNPTQGVLELGREEGVRVTGTVPDVRPYFEGAGLCIVPLRIGGGSRLKILSAMAMQKPVLSTTIGAEGLEVSDGEDIFLADGAEKFTAAVLRCLDQPQELARVAAAGRRLVEERYRWESLGEKLDAYLTKLQRRQ